MAALTDEQKRFLDENFKAARNNFLEAKRTTISALLIVTTGTFVLSISFLTAFATIPITQKWALSLSWVCMALSVMTYVAFAHHDAEAEGAVMEDIREKMISGIVPASYTPGLTGKAPAFYRRANLFLNTTYFLAALGIFLLLFFGIWNIAERPDPQFQQQYQMYLANHGWQ
jgi:uncharacterized membrane protein